MDSSYWADLGTTCWLRLAEWLDAAGDLYDEGMPKADESNRMKQFMLGDSFQEEFDTWAAKVEKEHNGKLVMTDKEPIVSASGATLGIIIWWRVDPLKTVSRGRGGRR